MNVIQQQIQKNRIFSLLQKYLTIPSGISAVVLFVSLSASYFFWKQALNQANEHINSEFHFRTQEVLNLIERRMMAYRDILKGAQTFFELSPHSRIQFASYIDKLSLNENYPGIQGIGFSLKISPSQLRTHENKIRMEGFKNYKVQPLEKREFYSSIIYLEPFKDRNLKAFGYDMLSEPTRAMAMKEAALSGQAVLSGKLKLIQENNENPQAGFIMYLPVHQNNHNGRHIHQKDLSNLIGWVYAPFRIDDLMLGILGQSHEDLSIKIFDGLFPLQEFLLYNSAAIQKASNDNFDLKVPSPQYTKQVTLTLLNRPWNINISSLPTFESRLDQRPANMIAVIGTLLSILMTYLVWYISTSHTRALQYVHSRTKTLYELNRVSKWIHQIDNILTEASTQEQTINMVLQLLAHESGWRVAGFWHVDTQTGNLTLKQMLSSNLDKYQDFINLSKTMLFEKGQGLPGRAFEINQSTKQVLWIPTLMHDNNFPRRQIAYRCGLKSGLAFQVKTSDNLLGILELFSEDIVEESHEINQQLNSIGLRMGHRLMSIKLATHLESEQMRFRQLMSALNASAIVTTADTKGKITSVNEKFCEISGYTEAELIGQDHRIVNSGLESKNFFKSMWQTISNKKTWVGEIRNRSKSGEIYIVSSVITPLLNKEGEIESYLSVRFDVTDQKKYHQQLIEAQNIAKIGSWHIDLKTNIISWSEEHYKIFGISDNLKNEQLEKAYRHCIHSDDLTRLNDYLTKAQLNGEDFILNHRIILDNSMIVKYVQVIGKVNKDATGKPLFINGTTQDITERVTQETEYQATLNSLGIGVWKYNPETQDLIWDSSMFKLYEIDESSFEKHYQAWESTLDTKTKARVINELSLALKGEKEFNTTFEILTKAKKRKYIGALGSVMRNQKGDAIMMYGVNWDRTKEFESEALLNHQKMLMKSVLDNIPNMVFVKDYKNGLRFTLLNKAGENLLGLQEKDIFGKNDYDFFPQDQALNFTNKDKETFIKKIVTKIDNEPIQTPTGIRYLRTYKVPTYDEYGNPHLLIGISTDITEELQIFHELNLERSKALHNAKLASLGEMAAGIAHEINNPMAIIAGNIPLFKKFKDQPEKFETKIESTLKACDRVAKIVNGLRKFSRSHKETPFKLESPTSIIHEILVFTETKAKMHNVSILTEFKSNSQIVCDAIEIEQVLINLVNNGIDAIKNESEKWIQIKTFDDKDQLVIQIIDSGHGISPEIESKLFQPFFTTKPVGEGTGLGLSISKGILDQHKASLNLNRSLKNTCFEIHFPIAKESKLVS